MSHAHILKTRSKMSVKYDFSGKTALVTGAGKGIGRAIAVGLLDSSIKRLIAISRTQSDLESLAKEYGSDRVVPMCLDVSDITAVKERLKDIGHVDLLVNNAGTNVIQNFLDVTEDAYDRVMDLNLKAVVFLSQLIARGMKERGEGGVILNVSSQASHVALTDHAVYCSSKAALDMLTKTMGLEFGQYNIRVNAINPTVTMTDLGKKAWGDPAKAGPMLARIPLKKFADVNDVAGTALFLLSNHSAMISCETILVDGGFCAC